MNLQDFAAEIEKARTRLQADYRSVTVSASVYCKPSSTSVFVSVKSPYWTHEMERREEDASELALSEWIYREVRLAHEPDIAEAAQAEGE